MDSDRIDAPPHEVKDADARPIVTYGVILTIGTLVVFVIVFGVFVYFTRSGEPDVALNPMASGQTSAPAGPHVEEYPAREYEQLRARELKVLSSYGWVDRNAGTVHIPIDRAMETVLRQGLPTRKEPVAQ